MPDRCSIVVVSDGGRRMKWCEIFKAGTHTDSNGNVRVWTDDDLRTIWNNFQKKNPDVPICCGHPKSSSPAYGWVDNLKIEGGKLYAAFKDVQNEFREAVNKGLFKTRSVSLTPDLTLRHIAFLGAQPPAIKGLEQFCFREENENEILIEFQEVNAKLMANDTTGEDLSSPPPLTEKDVGQALPDSIKSGNVLFEQHPLPQGEKMNEEEFSRQLAERDEKISALQKQIDEEKKAKQVKEFEDFCETALSKGQILPVQKQKVMDILTAVSSTAPFEFADGAEKTPVEMVKEFIGELKQINFEEIATSKTVQTKSNSVDFSDANSIKNGIIEIQNEYRKKGIELSSQEALNKLRGEE